MIAEVAGLLLVGAFLYVLWAPAVLLFAGVVLFLYGNAGERGEGGIRTRGAP